MMIHAEYVKNTRARLHTSDVTSVIKISRKIAHLLRVRVAELASARCNCVLHYVLPKHWQQILLVDGEEQVEPFRADHAELLVLVV